MRPLAAALFALSLAVPAPAFAGPIDLSYPAPKPDPTLTLVHGLFIPGGGWFHVSAHTEDAREAQTAQGWGAAFLGATALSTAVMVNNALKGDKKGLGLGLGMTLGLRYADLWGSVRRAHVTRYENRMGTREREDERPSRAQPSRGFLERDRYEERAPERESRTELQDEPRTEPSRAPEARPEPTRKSRSVLPVWLE